jgi:hypothetical protein
VWGVRAGAELPERLLYASSFPLGFPGCDNRIAYVMWSHGFRMRNPCYHVRSVHLRASTARAYHKTIERLYGGVSYVHPSLEPDEHGELEFTLLTRSQQRPAGGLVNQQAIEQGVHQLRHGVAEVAQHFLDQQQFTSLSWVHEAVGSAHLEGDMHPLTSEDPDFLHLPGLLPGGERMHIPKKGGPNNETALAVNRKREINDLTRDPPVLTEAKSSDYHEIAGISYLSASCRSKRMIAKAVCSPKIINARKSYSLSKNHVSKILNTINAESKARCASPEDIKRLITARNTRSNA